MWIPFCSAEIGDDWLARRQSFQSVGRDRIAFGADVFAKSEKGMMSAQILNCRFHALIDLDLLDPRIAFNVQNPIRNEQIVVEFLCAADVQNSVRIPVKLPNSFQSQAGSGIAR